MTLRSVTFEIVHLADFEYSLHRSESGGGTRQTVGNEFMRLLRATATCPAGSVSARLRFEYNPRPKSDNPQSRLRVSLTLFSHDERLLENLSALVSTGALTPLYGLDPTDSVPFFDYDKLTASCDVTRREDSIKPLNPTYMNERAPSLLYVIDPFKPNARCDYMGLDRTLSALNEPALIDIHVAPVDTEPEFRAHADYRATLDSCNHRWDLEEDRAQTSMTYFGEEPSPWASRREEALKALRVPEPLVDDVRREHQRFADSLRRPSLLFHIRAFGESATTARLVASAIADGAFEDGVYRLFDCSDGPRFKQAHEALEEGRLDPFQAHDSLFGEGTPDYFKGLSRLGHIATVEELSGAFRFPIAGEDSPRCIRKASDPKPLGSEPHILIGHDLSVGTGAPGSDLGMARGLPLKTLCKHMFLSGCPGSGKTMGLHSLTFQLSQHGVPFIIIEPAKREHRVFKSFKNHSDARVRALADSLRVFTLGEEELSPLRFNPFEKPQGISVDEHVGHLCNCISAAIPTDGSQPYIIADAFERMYRDCVAGPPLIEQFGSALAEVMSNKRLSSDMLSDLEGILAMRGESLSRRSMGKILQCRQSIPSVESLLESNSLIELDAISDHAYMSLSILFLLTAIRERIRTTPRKGQAPRLVIILEEAHVILGRSGDATASADVADPKAHATEFICRMLAEMRALDVGIVIANQTASAISPEVLKHTATKLSFNQMDEDDRLRIGKSMLLSEEEIEDMGRLTPGQAFFHTEGLYFPIRVKGVDVRDVFGEIPTLENDELGDIVRGEAWWREAQLERRALEQIRLWEQLKALNGRVDAFLSQARELATRETTSADQASSRRKSARNLVARARGALEDFRWQVLKPLQGAEIDIEGEEWDVLRESRQAQSDAFEAIRKCVETRIVKPMSNIVAGKGNYSRKETER